LRIADLKGQRIEELRGKLFNSAIRNPQSAIEKLFPNCKTCAIETPYLRNHKQPSGGHTEF
jgi:hypothetical protein